MNMFAASSAAVLMYAMSSTTFLIAVTTLVFLGLWGLKEFYSFQAYKEHRFLLLSEAIEDK